MSLDRVTVFTRENEHTGESYELIYNSTDETLRNMLSNLNKWCKERGKREYKQTDDFNFKNEEDMKRWEEWLAEPAHEHIAKEFYLEIEPRYKE